MKKNAVLTLFFVCISGLLSCSKPLPHYSIHTDFKLRDHNGKQFQMMGLQGKEVLIYFGFTRCPTLCPNTLARLQKAHTILGFRKHRLQILMITVDPKYDTPAVLKEYLSHYRMPVLGLWGTPSQIDSIVAQFGVVASASQEAKQLIDHTNYIFLLDNKLKIRYLFQEGDSSQKIASTIRRL